MIQAMEQREQDSKEIRQTLLEREDELVAATERIAELQAIQAETHDRLEDTLKNIERDNAEKDEDLIEANREVEAVSVAPSKCFHPNDQLGQRVYDLEEACDELKSREQQLDTDLRSADEAFDQAKSHYENLVAALKEARKKLQDERDEAISDARDLETRAIAERENSRREKEAEIDKIRRSLAEREQVSASDIFLESLTDRQVNARLQGELDAARDRVTQRDRDLSVVQGTLRSLETEKRKLGDEGSTARHGLELEIDRVERDLLSAEDDLQRAREEVERGEERLRQKDLELSNMVSLSPHTVHVADGQLDKQRDLETRLASERQGRLNISDKLDLANKVYRFQISLHDWC